MLKYTLIRKHNKNLYLRVRGGEVIVTAPMHTSIRKIDQFVQSHAQWIEKQKACTDRVLKNPDQINILEKSYQIVFIEGRRKIQGSTLYCRRDPAIFHRLILSLIHPWFQERFTDQCHRMNIKGWRLHIGFYSSKWGSCHPAKKEIRLNGNLAFTDKECIDAILVHELCHIQYRNHSSAFYQEVLRWMPSYKDVHQRLKQYKIPTL